METHVVQPIAPANAEHPFPRLLVHRGISCQWEIAVLHRAAQLGEPAVHIKHLSVYLELTHPESTGLFVRPVLGRDFRRQFIQCRIEFIPQLHFLAHVQHDLYFRLSFFQLHPAGHNRYLVRHIGIETLGRQLDFGIGTSFAAMLLQTYPHGGRTVVYVRINLYVFGIQKRRAPQFHTSHHTIPVSLCLVGHAMRVRSHTNAVDTIADAQRQSVFPAFDIVRHVITMRHAQAVVAPDFLSVDPQFRLDMRTLKIQYDATVLPISRNFHRPSVPGRPHIVAVWRQEKRQLEVLFPTVFLHVRVIKIGTVVERPCPLRFHRRPVALQTLRHTAGQQDTVFQRPVVPLIGCSLISPVDLKLPLSRQVQTTLCEQLPTVSQSEHGKSRCPNVMLIHEN